MIEKIFKKYQTLGGEIEKINVEISKYKDEMTKTNYTLDEMYENNIKYYMELEKYVVAGQMKLEEMQSILPSYEEKAASGNQLAQMRSIHCETAFRRLRNGCMIWIWHGWWLFKRHLKSVSCGAEMQS